MKALYMTQKLTEASKAPSPSTGMSTASSFVTGESDVEPYISNDPTNSTEYSSTTDSLFLDEISEILKQIAENRVAVSPGMCSVVSVSSLDEF
jgi:hypothetical protein